MTVANNNLPSGLLAKSAINTTSKSSTNPVAATEAKTSMHSTSSKTVKVNKGEAASSVDHGKEDQSFEAIVKRQMSKDSSADNAQVTDSKEVSSQLSGTGQTLTEADAATQWMQNLKAHFAELESAGITGETSDIADVVTDLASTINAENLTDDIPLNANAKIVDSEDMKISETDLTQADQSGEALPPSGQVVSAVMSVSKSQSESKSDTRSVSGITQQGNESSVKEPSTLKPTIAVSGDDLSKGGLNQKAAGKTDNPINAALLNSDESNSEEADMEFNLDKHLLDKAANKSANQQVSMSSAKETVSTIATTLTQTSAVQTQNTSASQLPPNLQNMSISPQSTNTQWGEALGERVSFLVNHKLNSAEIRIDPPHLGKLDIQIQVKDDTATVTIHTQHAQTRDLIESASARLREFLQEAGYSSVDVDVSHQEQSMQQDMAERGRDQSIDEENDMVNNTEQGVLSSAQMMSMNLDTGRIDYFA